MTHGDNMVEATPIPTTPKTNKLGMTRNDYIGSASTLCPGCGHD